MRNNRNIKIGVYLLVLFTSTLVFIILKNTFNFPTIFSSLIFAMPGVSAIFLRFIFSEKEQNLNIKINGISLVLLILAPTIIEWFTFQLQILLGFESSSQNIFTGYNGPSISLLPIIVLISIGEEIGIRGFLQFQLVSKYGTLVGIFLVGVIWGFWRVTFLIIPNHPIQDVIIVSGFVFVFTLLYSISVGIFYERRKSILTAILINVSTYITFLLNNDFILNIKENIPELLIRIGIWILFVEFSLWVFVNNNYKKEIK